MTRLVEDYLLVWVVLAVVIGTFVPAAAVVTRASTAILVVMVGSTSLLLSIDDLRAVNRRVLGGIVIAQLAMVGFAFGLATLLGMSPAVTAGFVLLGAITPELVSPTMTALVEGDVALSSLALVVIGGVSVGYAPASVTLFLGNAIHVDVWRIVEELIIAVVAPMAVAIAIRTRYEQAVARYDDSYSTVASLMVVLIIGGVAAANASLLHGSLDRLVLIGSAAFALNVVGYGLGWGAARLAGGTQSERLAGVFTVGMRDFAVAAALVVAAGFPTTAALPAILFGVIEMTTSAGLVRLTTTRG